AQEVGRLAHQLGALESRGLAPHLEAPGDGFERRIEVRSRRMRHLADHLARRRVDDVDGAAFGGIAPLAINQELRVGIVVFGHGSYPFISMKPRRIAAPACGNDSSSQKNACNPVWARPRMRACTSCVPS